MKRTHDHSVNKVDKKKKNINNDRTNNTTVNDTEETTFDQSQKLKFVHSSALTVENKENLTNSRFCEETIKAKHTSEKRNVKLEESAESEEKEELKENESTEDSLTKTHENIEDYSGFKEGSLFLDYVIEHSVGAGSFGKVYAVRKLSTNDMYAMKVMTKADGLSEWAIHEKMLHIGNLPPSLLVATDYLENDQTVMILSKLMSADLSLFTKYNVIPSLSLIRSIIYQLGLAIEFLHKNGYIHRDIKPDNVLIKLKEEINRKEKDDISLEDMTVCLGDLGLTIHHRDRFNSVAGTRCYFPPELLAGHVYSYPVDIFALGCIILYLLTGIHFFYAPTPQKQYQMIKRFYKNLKQHTDYNLDCRHIKLVELRDQELATSTNQNNDDNDWVKLYKLLEGMVRPNDVERFTIQDVMNSEFFK